MEPTPAAMQALPDELVEMFLSWLTPHELLNIRSCTTWLKIIVGESTAAWLGKTITIRVQPPFLPRTVHTYSQGRLFIAPIFSSLKSLLSTGVRPSVLVVNIVFGTRDITPSLVEAWRREMPSSVFASDQPGEAQWVAHLTMHHYLGHETKSFGHLEHLDLSHSKNVFNVDHLRNVRTLILNGCTNLTHVVGLQDGKIQHLSLDRTGVTHEMQSFTRLASLNVTRSTLYLRMFIRFFEPLAVPDDHPSRPFCHDCGNRIGRTTASHKDSCVHVGVCQDCGARNDSKDVDHKPRCHKRVRCEGCDVLLDIPSNSHTVGCSVAGACPECKVQLFREGVNAPDIHFSGCPFREDSHPWRRRDTEMSIAFPSPTVCRFWWPRMHSRDQKRAEASREEMVSRAYRERIMFLNGRHFGFSVLQDTLSLYSTAVADYASLYPSIMRSRSRAPLFSVEDLSDLPQEKDAQPLSHPQRFTDRSNRRRYDRNNHQRPTVFKRQRGGKRGRMQGRHNRRGRM